MAKRVFITGASKGIGQATAYEFSRHKWGVVFTYNKDLKGARETASECKRLGASSVEFFRLDVAKDVDIRRVAKQVRKVDVLVNNAGVLVHWGKFEKIKFEEIEKILRTNLEGMIKLTAALLPNVKSVIVNIASRAGKFAHKNDIVYCASKFGVRGFTQGLADEFPKLKIFAVNPGLVATDMTEFEGAAPSRVAKIIYEVVVGKRLVKSGGDVDVWKIVGG